MSETLKMFSYDCNGLSELPAVVNQLMKDAGNHKIFAFYGEMGAGKTTVIKEICEYLTVTDHTSSPTFTIVNEYATHKGETVYHFDFYRIKNESEAFDLGFENYLYSGNYCFIEWPDKVQNLLPTEMAVISIEADNEKRIITMRL